MAEGHHVHHLHAQHRGGFLAQVFGLRRLHQRASANLLEFNVDFVDKHVRCCTRSLFVTSLCILGVCFCSIPACVFGSRFRVHDRHHDRIAYRRCIALGWISVAALVILYIVLFILFSVFDLSLPRNLISADEHLSSAAVVVMFVSTVFLLTAILAFLATIILWNERANEGSTLEHRHTYKPHKEWGVPTFAENDAQFPMILSERSQPTTAVVGWAGRSHGGAIPAAPGRGVSRGRSAGPYGPPYDTGVGRVRSANGGDGAGVNDALPRNSPWQAEDVNLFD